MCCMCMVDAFLSVVLCVCGCREENADTPVKFTYTPLHGVGQKFAEAAFEAFNFPPLISVPEQVLCITVMSCDFK